MHRYLILDLDGTLAPIDAPASKKTARFLALLEKTGYVICICSGKPTYYLCGFARQLGLRSPVLIGENGAVLQFGYALPPEKHLSISYPEETKTILKILEKEIKEHLGSRVWFQPNTVALTPFLQTEADCTAVEEILSAHRKSLSNIRVYRQANCFDILPIEVSKKEGLKLLAKETMALSADFIAVGDGQNDLPMFDFADISFWIGKTTETKATYTFQNIEEVLEYIFMNKL